MAFNLSNISFSWEELDKICGTQEEVSFSDFERLPHSTPIRKRPFGNPDKRATKKRLVFEDSIEAATDNQGPQAVDCENKEMLDNPLDLTLHELAKHEMQKLMPEDSQKKKTQDLFIAQGTCCSYPHSPQGIFKFFSLAKQPILSGKQY